MSPVGTAGLFRATMIHTMHALRENSDLLLSTMNVFIKEPLMEWVVRTMPNFTLLACHSLHLGTCPEDQQASLAKWYVKITEADASLHARFPS